ncbi:uncharacterized protein GGS22DRAFT_197215 [Annulohypoxylon maeteangense]|uniref:uncharacterized protein n=1 Tax=Annulohypoxylon maeteangense TaxID=1927788 RepID=UPI00200862CD|nr:uncharacterized protein GGS22DRAFT_197215 [Annulohypoxylon maeteangense]KAI0880869.1 hypothetical protein GGS22DRAFT_197215 [Annulohypoxylon maeteangense]
MESSEHFPAGENIEGMATPVSENLGASSTPEIAITERDTDAPDILAARSTANDPDDSGQQDITTEPHEPNDLDIIIDIVVVGIDNEATGRTNPLLPQRLKRRRQIQESDTSAAERGEHRGHQGTAFSTTNRPLNPVVNQVLCDNSLSGARITVFPKSNNVLFPENSDIEAERFLGELEKKRENGHFKEVPIVLIDTGYGYPIIEQLFGHIQSSASNISNMISTVVFLETIVPYPQEPGKGEPQNSQSENDPMVTWYPRTIQVSDYWKTLFTELGWTNNIESWRAFCNLAKEWGVSVVGFGQSASNKEGPQFHDNFMKFVPYENRPEKPAQTTDSQDPNYRQLVDEIQTGLFIKALSDQTLESLLEVFIRRNYNVSLQEHKRTQLIHKAASCVYGTALLHLISAAPRLAASRSEDGSTPLHLVIRKAVDDKPDKNGRAEFESIISKLVATLEDLPGTKDLKNVKDVKGKSAWEYASEDEHQWIRELKRYSVTTGNKITPDAKTLPENLVTGTPNDVQTRACKKSEATVAQFYVSEDGRQDSFNKQQLPVYWLLYNTRPRIREFFKQLSSAEEKKKKTCRWIHLPANNERWVYDLFSQLEIVDTSTSGKRHEGVTTYDRHMIAGTEKYTQLSLNTSMSPKRARSVGGSHRRSILAQNNIDLNPPARAGRSKEDEGRDASTPLSRNISDTNNAKKTEETAFVLFMPILGFEKHEYRKRLKLVMENPTIEGNPPMDETPLLVQAYYDQKEVSLHCRRTLDQFTYTMLPDTEERDSDQVISKWWKQKEQLRKGPPRFSKEELKNKSPVLMVDQLWLWILEGEATVMTCFPDAWDSTAGYNLLQQILRKKAKRKDNRPLVQSTTSLANLILGCSVDFIRRDGPMRVSLKESFQSSIADIARKQSTQFQKFKRLVEELQNSSQLDQNDRAIKTDGLFQLTEESHLMASIMDIQDELKSIKDVFKKQNEVLVRFHQLTKDDYKDNLRIVESNIAAVEEMEMYAEKVHIELKGLLSLKQKQANAWEARFAREGSEHTQRQSKITMVFTIVTILFLPLSFMSSVFAIQVDVFPRDATSQIAWPIDEVMGLLFGISFAVIIPLIIVAFRVNQISSAFSKAAGYIWPSKNLPVEECRDERNNHVSDLHPDSLYTISRSPTWNSTPRRSSIHMKSRRFDENIEDLEQNEDARLFNLQRPFMASPTDSTGNIHDWSNLKLSDVTPALNSDEGDSSSRRRFLDMNLAHRRQSIAGDAGSILRGM